MGLRDRTHRVWSRAHASPPGRRLAPGIHARSAIVLDQDGQTLWAKRPDLPLHGRSTIKLLTCLTARDHLNLETVVTVSADDVSPTTVLEPGDVLSVANLIHAALLYSDNTATLALARSAGERLTGDGDALTRFLAAMHDRGHRAGWTGRVTDARGFGEGNRVTARGMTRLLQAIALEDPWLYRASRPIQHDLTITGRRETRTTVRNRSLEILPDFVAAKSGTHGFQPHSDAYLVWSWRHEDGTTRTAALMGSDARNRHLDAEALQAK